MLHALTYVATVAVAYLWLGAGAAPSAEIRLLPSEAPAGQSIVIEGTITWGSTPPTADDCGVAFAGRPIVGVKCSYDTNGRITGSFDVPADAQPGVVTVHLCGPSPVCGGEIALWDELLDFTVQPDPLSTPDLTCLSYDAANRAVQALKLVFLPPDWGEAPVGWQDPVPDGPIQPGATVDAGPAIVPDLVGDSLEQAADEVTATCGVLATEGDESGLVESQDPVAGGPMVLGGEVLARFPTPTVTPTTPPVTPTSPTVTPTTAGPTTPTRTPTTTTATPTRTPTSPTATVTPTRDPAIDPADDRDDHKPRRRWMVLTGAGAVAGSLVVGGALLLRTRGALGGLPPDLHIEVQDRSTRSRLDGHGRGISHVLVRRAPVTRLEEDPDDH
jgi:hypothetical protein